MVLRPVHGAQPTDGDLITMAKKHTKRRLAAMTSLVLAAAMMTGCATQPQALYHWGDFESQQYGYLSGTKAPEESIQNIEKVREEAKSMGKTIPPGMSAHLGMLYGLTGRTDLFEQHLLAERTQFPESSAYVDFLLKQTPKK